VTLKAAGEQDLLLHKVVCVKGKQATISGVSRGARRLRVLSLPWWVPPEVIGQMLVGRGITIKRVFQDKERDTRNQTTVTLEHMLHW